MKFKKNAKKNELHLTHTHTHTDTQYSKVHKQTDIDEMRVSKVPQFKIKKKSLLLSFQYANIYVYQRKNSKW